MNNPLEVIQKRLDEIYGPGRYQARQDKAGYFAYSLDDHKRPPHNIQLGYPAEALVKLNELEPAAKRIPITLAEAIEFFPNIAYSTLAQAAREGRVEARQSGPKTWITTRAAIEQAIEEGKVRPRS